MITKVRVRNFKAFEEQVFDLSNHIVLAGPNNSGKTTLLQAIVAWNLALQRWGAERRPSTGGRGKRGVPITRKDFTAIPLREMNLLWTNTSTALKKYEGKQGHPRVLQIELASDQGWSLTFEFRYQSAEQIYAKPIESDIETATAADVSVAHVPPFSGIGVQETRYDRPYQDLLVGQGKPGDILRNLLLEIHTREDKADWRALTDRIEQLFGYELQAPRYTGLPFIVCEYVPSATGPSSARAPLDISCAGSGFHQVLMLLAFFYARPSTMLLLDEPDAHLHVVLQKQIYDLLRQVAVERRCQLVIATHAEVLIDSTSPELILSFFQKPHRLISATDRDQVREALKRLPAMDILQAERSAAILYVEGERDFNLLRAWARVLNHPLREWFDGQPFWHANQGRHPREARGHFFALRAIKPDARGVLVLDGDNRGLSDGDIAAPGLPILRWTRYEAESYLMHPEALMRFVEASKGPLFAAPARSYLRDQLPPAVFRQPLDDHDLWANLAVSKTLLPAFFATAQLEITKPEFFLVAEQMKPEEVPHEVRSKLDEIEAIFRL